MDRDIKIVGCGDISTGKTSMIIRLTRNTAPNAQEATIGVSYLKHTMKVDSSSVTINIWDTSGDERFRSCVPSYFRGAMGVFVVYDVSREDTFDSLDYWISMAREMCGENVEIVLVGAKCDKENVVTEDRAMRYAEEKGLPLVICSSMTGVNVHKVFETLVRSIVKTYKLSQSKSSTRSSDKPNVSLSNNHQDDSSCC